jgi:hypothetical protein
MAIPVNGHLASMLYTSFRIPQQQQHHRKRKNRDGATKKETCDSQEPEMSAQQAREFVQRVWRRIPLPA